MSLEHTTGLWMPHAPFLLWISSYFILGRLTATVAFSDTFLILITLLCNSKRYCSGKATICQPCRPQPANLYALSFFRADTCSSSRSPRHRWPKPSKLMSLEHTTKLWTPQAPMPSTHLLCYTRQLTCHSNPDPRRSIDTCSSIRSSRYCPHGPQTPGPGWCFFPFQITAPPVGKVTLASTLREMLHRVADSAGSSINHVTPHSLRLGNAVFCSEAPARRLQPTRSGKASTTCRPSKATNC